MTSMMSGYVHLIEGEMACANISIHGGLLEQGLMLTLHRHYRNLLAALSSYAVAGPRVIVLADTAASSCEAATAIRAVDVHTPIAAVLRSVDAKTLIMASEHGIDACWHAATPPDRLAAAIRRLSAGAGLDPAPSGAPSADEANWVLVARGWQLQAPNGAIALLTSAERDLILALARTRGHRLSHGELMAVIDKTAEPVMEVTGRRLSVLLSRMRQKCLAATGMELPIRSVRGVGYELSVSLLAPGLGGAAVDQADAATALYPRALSLP